MDFSVSEGDLVTVINSVWRYKSQQFTQTLILPKNSKEIELKFEVFAEAGDEIFLRFSRQQNEDDWLYTFNSADIRLRKPFPESRVYQARITTLLLAVYSSKMQTIICKSSLNFH